MDGTDCTAEEMSKALEHSLGGLGNSVLDNDPNRILVSEKVSCYYIHSYIVTIDLFPCKKLLLMSLSWLPFWWSILYMRLLINDGESL